MICVVVGGVGFVVVGFFFVVEVWYIFIVGHVIVVWLVVVECIVVGVFFEVFECIVFGVLFEVVECIVLIEMCLDFDEGYVLVYDLLLRCGCWCRVWYTIVSSYGSHGMFFYDWKWCSLGVGMLTWFMGIIYAPFFIDFCVVFMIMLGSTNGVGVRVVKGLFI